MSKAEDSIARQVLTDPVHILAFGFGTGLAPVAPGTVGSLLGVALAWLTLELPLMAQVSIAVALSVAGIWICGSSARKLGVHDHGGIVWDEILGYLVTMAAAPAGWHWMLVGFLLFRLFDILKPWPIRWADRRVAVGVGMMLDGLRAGAYAWLCLQGLALLPWFGG